MGEEALWESQGVRRGANSLTLTSMEAICVANITPGRRAGCTAPSPGWLVLCCHIQSFPHRNQEIVRPVGIAGKKVPAAHEGVLLGFGTKHLLQ